MDEKYKMSNIYAVLIIFIFSGTLPSMQLRIPHFNPIDANSKIAVQLISKIAVQMASACDIVLHFDNSTAYFVDTICNETNSEKTDKVLLKTNYFHYQTNEVIYIINNRDIKYQGDITFLDCIEYFRNIIHVVILSNASDFQSMFLDNVQKHNIILYICFDKSTCSSQYSDTNILNPSFFLNTTFVKRVYLVMVLEINNDVVKLYKICFYCGVDSQKLILKHEVKMEERDDLKTNSLIIAMTKEIEFNFKDFSSHIFRVAFPQDRAYMRCKTKIINVEIGDDIFSECSKLSGFEGSMLEEISKRLKFRFALVNPKKHQEEGTWKNMVKDVFEEKVDFAISSILVSDNRLKKVQFSSVVGIDPLRVVYMNRRNLLAEGVIIAFVFSWQTWCILVVTITILSCITYVTNCYLNTKHLTLARSFWIVGSILVDQGIGKSSRIPGRRFLGSWIICCIIIGTIYKAKLTSVMINPTAEHLANLDELARAGYEAYLHESDGSLVVEAFQQSEDPVLQQLSKKTHDDLNICNALKKSLNSDTFLIEEQLPTQIAINEECLKIMTREEMSRIRVTQDNMLPSSHAWPFSKNAPYLQSINYFISLFYENGLQLKLRSSLRNTLKRNFIDFDKGIVKTDANQLKIKLFGPFLLWGCGITLSIICFFVETLSSFCKALGSKPANSYLLSNKKKESIAET